MDFPHSKDDRAYHWLCDNINACDGVGPQADCESCKIGYTDTFGKFSIPMSPVCFPAPTQESPPRRVKRERDQCGVAPRIPKKAKGRKWYHSCVPSGEGPKWVEFSPSSPEVSASPSPPGSPEVDQE